MEYTKPILVTGATGSIGSVLVRRLTGAGQSVRAVVRNPERAAQLKAMQNVEIVPGDLRWIRRAAASTRFTSTI